jgi:hypothetical protein
MAGNEANPQGYLDFWGNTPTDPTTAQGKTFAPVSSGSSNADPLPPQLKGGQSRIINQIEQAADYYGPAIYQLLGFHSSLELSSDLNEDFIPIAQTKANPKLFVVGLIPPTANVTGRTLDRSASIGATQGYPDQQLDFTGPSSLAAGGALSTGGSSRGPYITAAGYSIDQGSGTLNGNIKSPEGASIDPNNTEAQKTRFTLPQLYNTMTDAYRAVYGKEPTPTEIQFYTAQCIRETSGISYSNNFGNMVNYGKTPPANTPSYYSPSDGNYYKAFDSTQAGAQAYIKRVTSSQNVVTAAQNGDALGYVVSSAQTGYFGDSVGSYYSLFPNILTQISKAMNGSGVSLGSGSDLPSSAPKCCAFNQTWAMYAEHQAHGSSTNGGRGLTPQNLYRFNSGSVYDDSCPLIAQAPQDQDGSNGDWNTDGSPNASASRKNDDKTSDRIDLNKTELGQQYQNAQRAESAMTAKALDIMRAMPPLRLLVNPASFKISSEKVVSDGNFTREGPIIEHWSEQQDKLSLSGKIAAFFAIDSQPSSDQNNLGGGPGLTRVARQYSASYQNFLSLYLLYRNNGGLFVNTLNDTLNNNLLARLSLVGSIYIYYDNTLYIGSFDSFNVTEADTAPYSLEYNIEFTVRATFLLDGPTETDFNLLKSAQQPQTLPTTSNQSLVSNTGGGQVPFPPGLDPSVYAALNETEAASYDFRTQSTGGT